MKRRWVRLALISPLYSLLLLIFSSDTSLDPKFVLPLALCFSGVGFLAAILSLSTGLFLIGAGLFVLPMFGTGVLNIFLCGVLLGFEIKRLQPGNSLGVRYGMSARLLLFVVFVFLLAFFGGAIRTFRLESDFLLYRAMIESVGFSGLFSYLMRQFSSWNDVPVLVSGYLLWALLALFFVEVDQATDRLGAVFLGIALGVCFSVFVLVGQFFELHPILSLRRSSFWLLTGRYSSSFSDPNAFGVCTGLLAPVLLLCGGSRWWKWFFRFCAVLLLAGVSLSGSRTVWLALLLWAIVWLLRNVHENRRRVLGRSCLVGIVVLALVVGIVGNPSINRKLEKTFTAPGIYRLIKSCHWEHGPKMFASRFVYADIAFGMWRESPVVGVGLGRFYGQQERVASKLGIDLHGWRDNANNFYLQILAEMGFLGFFLVLLSFYLCWRIVSGEATKEIWSDSPKIIATPQTMVRIGASGLVVLAIILCTGPHFFFDEVRYLSSVLLAIGVSNIQRKGEHRFMQLRRAFLILGVLILVVFGLCGGREKEIPFAKGFYPMEYSSHDGFFSWTGKQAQIPLCLPPGQSEIYLSLKSLHPDLSKRPLSLRITQQDQKTGRILLTREVQLINHDWRQVSLNVKETSSDSLILVKFDVARLWSPSSANPNGDLRWLGVMLQWPSEVCK